MEREPTKFLGLRKEQFLVVLVFLGLLANGLTVTYAAWSAGKRAAEIQALSLESLRHNCAQRTYAQEQVTSSANFLAKHPGDIFLGGIRIPRAQLVQSLDRQEKFLGTFRTLDCRQFGGSGPAK